MKQTKKKYEDPTRKDWIIGIGLIGFFLFVIAVGGLVLIPDHWIWWLLLVLVGTLLLALNQNKNYACRCRECEHEFELRFITNLISPHGVDTKGSWLWVKCPSCKTRGKVSVIRIVKEE